MAKYGYTCQCGWRLNRGTMTRREYAEAKRKHSIDTTIRGKDTFGCQSLKKELEQSRKVPAK